MVDAHPVLLFGIPSEPPLVMVKAELDRLGVPHLLLNQRRCADAHIHCRVDGGSVTGALVLDGEQLPLEAFGGVYTRGMSYSLLPEVRGRPPDDPLYRHAARFHQVLESWCDVMPGRAVNRTPAMGSNGSKPYQAQLIAPYFRVPATLVTNDPEEVLAFRAEHGRLVYKSISGVRSIVQEFGDEDVARLPQLRTCPAHFQEYVEGVDVRVHTLADGQLFATEVQSDATDYRYGHREDDGARLSPIELPDDVSERCLALATGLGLDFAGLDLRVTPGGEVFCFEVNPFPAFSYYEDAAGQPIARALAAYLAGTTG